MVGTGTSGTSSTQLSYPMGAFIDANQNIYVADYSNNRIQKYVYGKSLFGLCRIVSLAFSFLKVPQWVPL